MSEKKLCCVIAENPLLILFLGACTAMGATTTLLGAVAMGVAAVDLLIFGTADESCVVRAVKNGLRFLVILVIMGLIREVLGSGSVAGFDIPFLADYTIPVMTKAPGGFVGYSILAAVISKLHKNPKLEGNGAACAAAGLDVCCCKNEEVEQ